MPAKIAIYRRQAICVTLDSTRRRPFLS